MCILLLLYVLLYVNLAQGEECTTPSGKPGECVPIRSCPSFLGQFSNPENGSEKYLLKYLCSRDNFTVCCNASDKLEFENEDTDPNDVRNLKQLTNTEDCGIASEPKIHNGMVRLQDFPWLVKIMIILNTNTRGPAEVVGCTGVLINKLYVLYSALCFHSLLKTYSARFVIIQTYTNKEEGCDATSYSPQCSYYESYESILHKAHPFYFHQSKLNDIAIIRLSRRVHNSDYIRPICLPISFEPVKEGQVVQIAGWNRTFNEISVKNAESSMVISNLDCQSRLLKKGKNVSISQYEMCTHTDEKILGISTIGFPLMSLRGNRWYLEGFESQGENTKVHSRIQSYLEWIKREMGGERCLTPYNEIGEAREFSDCPRLIEAIVNVSSNDEEIMRNFLFEYPGADRSSYAYSMKVCCGVTSNFTIPPETINKSLDLDVFDVNRCGIQGSSVSEEFPWLAVIVNASLPKQRQLLCAGSVITDRYVLTTAQCSNRLKPLNNILVRLGISDHSNASDCTHTSQSSLSHCAHVQEYRIEKEIVHPFYDQFTFINALSLLRLSGKVTFTDYVRPICLPRSEDDLGKYGETLFTTGFGYHSATFVGLGKKKKIATTLIENYECKEKFKMLGYILPITPYIVCTEDLKNSTDVVCLGDEGGPLMYLKESKWFIVGITGKDPCRFNETQVHLNLYKYLKWITLNVKY